VPRSLPYPKNLFVIGTVNVDETTCKFPRIGDSKPKSAHMDLWQ
jgi:hypothetical protein